MARFFLTSCFGNNNNRKKNSSSKNKKREYPSPNLQQFRDNEKKEEKSHTVHIRWPVKPSESPTTCLFPPAWPHGSRTARKRERPGREVDKTEGPVRRFPTLAPNILIRICSDCAYPNTIRILIRNINVFSDLSRFGNLFHIFRMFSDRLRPEPVSIYTHPRPQQNRPVLYCVTFHISALWVVYACFAGNNLCYLFGLCHSTRAARWGEISLFGIDIVHINIIIPISTTYTSSTLQYTRVSGVSWFAGPGRIIGRHTQR